MFLDQHIDLNALEKHIRDGLVTRRLHPKWPLAILNYSKLAMDKTHDDQNLRRCRGLIYDHETMEVIARPMEAFFNVNDTRYPETSLQSIIELTKQDGVVMEVSEKLDGSMGIVYQYKDNPPEVATRGSFESPQALWATAYLQRHYGNFRTLSYTHIVEIIYPENQIVVDYHGKSDLTLLAVIKTETGGEVNHGALYLSGLPVVPLYDKSPAQCAVENGSNREGYVLKFTIPGRALPIRFKAKFEDYRLAHKAMFGMNSRDVWEMWRDANLHIDLSPFSAATPGFNRWLRLQLAELDASYSEQMTAVEAITKAARDGLGTGMTDSVPLRKYVAEFVTYYAGDLRSACFACYDGKDYGKVIIKGLRPERALSYKEMPAEAE